jgi:3-deoxy-D-manno-octulosonic-acid transferase
MAETSPHPAFGHLLPKGEGQDSTPDIRHLNPETRNPTPDPRNPSAILLVDAVGELGAWWGVATIGFVGGSLGRRGGQNMIEPAAYGCAVSFGPNTRNFRDIVENLLAHQAAIVVSDGAELTRFVESCLMTPDEAAALGRRARAFVATQLGATNRTVDLLETMLGVAESATSRAA